MSTSPLMVVGGGLVGLVRSFVVITGALVVFTTTVGAGGRMRVVEEEDRSSCSRGSHFGGPWSYWPLEVHVTSLGPTSLKPGKQEYSMVVPKTVEFLLEFRRPFVMGSGASQWMAANVQELTNLFSYL